MRTSPGLYERRIFPWLNDKLTADPALLRLRTESLAAARGRTIEVGFGSGMNLAHYPRAVTELVAVEPNPGMLERAAARIGGAPFPVEVVHAAAESLPMADRSFETAVSVLTLCTVSEPASVLTQLRRVLRDDGQLIVLEHGLADQAAVARWQGRLDWLQGKLACGCHLNRPIRALVERSGFRFETVREFFVPKIPPTHGWITLGVAVKC